jgi:hypothetical protein
MRFTNITLAAMAIMVAGVLATPHGTLSARQNDVPICEDGTDQPDSTWDTSKLAHSRSSFGAHDCRC